MSWWSVPSNDMAAVFLTQKVEFDGALHHDIREAIYGPDYTGD